VVGVLPYFDCSHLDEEDTLDTTGASRGAQVAVVRLPYLSNFTDFEPLARQLPLSWARRPEELTGARVIMIPGTRNTLHDLQWLEDTGLASAIKHEAGKGSAVIGIYGGFQMLGEKLVDPDGIEGPAGEHDGLGLLPLTVRFELPKTTNRVSAHVTKDIPVLPGLKGRVLNGYEIHTERASVSGGAYPLLFEREGREPERGGAVSEIGAVFGTHLHGLFNNGAAVEALCRFLGREPAPDIYDERAETSLGELASIVRENLDMEFVRGLNGPS